MFGSYVIDSSAFLGIIDRRGAICQVRAMSRSHAEDVSAVLSAYLLIQTELGKIAHVAHALSDLDGVESAEDLAGPYDVIARVQAPGLDQLGRLVVTRIQVVDRVTRTLTCTVLHRQPRDPPPPPHVVPRGAEGI